MSDEFSDREKQAGLGDLNEQLLRERGDYVEPSKPYPGAIPGVRSAPVSEGPVGLNIPEYDISVKTVFDARPLNARDWVHQGYSFIYPTNGGVGNADAILEYTVPDGAIAILRGFKYDTLFPTIFTSTQEVAGDQFNAATSSIYVNNIIREGYQNMKLGQVVLDYVPCYIIANENSIIKLHINYGTPTTPTINSGVIYTYMYGNILLKNGLPHNLIPGNTDPRR